MRTLGLILSLGISFAMSTVPSAMADGMAGGGQIRDDAPDRHVVVKGDTLWDISAKFLKTPWLWPELWQANRDHIRNPHLIYPGDVVYLIMTPDGPRLSKMETVKLSPTVHATPIIVEDAIPTIPYATVKAFLQRPLVADGAALAKAPKLIASEDGRVMITLGDRVYADAVATDAKDWNIVRLGKPLLDSASGEEIAREVEFVGSAKTLARGRPATLEITQVDREILMGDRLIPAVAGNGLDFVPRAPAKQVEGRIISAYGGSQSAGRYSTVIIDKGRADGLDLGHVLAVFRDGRTIGAAATEGRLKSYSPKSGYLDGNRERERQAGYKNFWEELVDFLDPFDFFYKPFPDGRRGWRYMDYKCLKPGTELVAGEFHDPAKVMEDCPEGEEQKAGNWAYMDIGCLKPGSQITFGEFFDPKEVYEPHCRPEVARLPDVETGHVLIYRVFDRVAYGLVMDSPRPIYLLDGVRNP